MKKLLKLFALCVSFLFVGCEFHTKKNDEILAGKVWWLKGDIHGVSNQWVVVTNHSMRAGVWQVVVRHAGPPTIQSSGLSGKPLTPGTQARLVGGNFDYDSVSGGQYVRIAESAIE